MIVTADQQMTTKELLAELDSQRPHIHTCRGEALVLSRRYFRANPEATEYTAWTEMEDGALHRLTITPDRRYRSHGHLY